MRDGTRFRAVAALVLASSVLCSADLNADTGKPASIASISTVRDVTPPSREQRTVALTFDDLPYARSGDAGSEVAARRSSDVIRRALRRHAAPATGFVNEAKIRELGATGLSIVKTWNTGRLEFGKHGYSHADSNELTLDRIAEEVTRGEATIKPLATVAGRHVRYFRFPFNHVGDTEERRTAIEQLLASRGYVLAASTIDTSDYVFDRAHERAIAAHDASMRSRIEKAYLGYSRTQVTYYANLSRTVLGYEPPEIMLLHLNRLNASVIEPLLGLFEEAGYRFVTLDLAYSDPAYRRSPAVATKYGPMWGYRWAKERKIKVDGHQEQDPPAWLTTYADGR